MMRTALMLVLALTGLNTAPAGAQPAAEEGSSDYESRKREEELRKLDLENDKLEREEAEARRKEIVGNLPDATTTGKIDVKSGSGQMEANVLSTVALNSLARPIALETLEAATRSAATPALWGESDPCKISVDQSVYETEYLPEDQTEGASARMAAVQRDPARFNLPPVLLIPGTEKVSFANWEQFRFVQCTLKNSFDQAIEDANLLTEKPVKGGGRSAAGLTAAVGAASKLLQLLAPDWELAGISVTKSDKALMAAVAREYVRMGGRVFWTGQVARSGGANEVFAMMAELDAKDREATRLLARLDPELTTAQKAVAGKKAPQRAKDIVKTHAGPVAALKAAQTAYHQLVTQLRSKEGATALPLDQVVTEAALSRTLGRDGLVLNLSVGTAGGGYYTQKAIWNALGIGGPPFYVSGGVDVMFMTVRPADQQLFGGGAFSCMADYGKINRVAARSNPASAPASLGCREDTRPERRRRR